MQALITEKREQIAELCRQHHVKRLAVFGSAVRDDFDPETSDVDLLVEFEEAKDSPFLKNWFDLRDRLATVLGRKVDLIPDGPIRNPVLRKNVERDRVELYAA